MSDCSRRQFLQASSVLLPAALFPTALSSCVAAAPITDVGVALEPYPDTWLPAGIRSRFANDINGLRIHVLEAEIGRAHVCTPVTSLSRMPSSA